MGSGRRAIFLFGKAGGTRHDESGVIRTKSRIRCPLILLGWSPRSIAIAILPIVSEESSRRVHRSRS